MSAAVTVSETSPICSCCGEPVGDICYPGPEGSTECMSDGYFQGGIDGIPRTWFHHRCPAKRHLLPWVSILAQRRKQAA